MHDSQESKSDLIQLIDEKDSIISRITEEKYQLETELNTLRRKATKSLLSRMETSKAVAVPITCRKNDAEIGVSQRNVLKSEVLDKCKQHLMATYTARKAERQWNPQPYIHEINTKLTSGLNLIESLGKCIMGIQCDMKLVEAKEKPKARGMFGEELLRLKGKIRTLVEMADRQDICCYSMM
eukprot:TRINITY_DN11679_c0_g4_i2.p1 TRINITY_DN11679_c0_g4~~TRINITY_DN11679_c0_g4_i2.p1  ORF type:complete len:182 (+),score=45.72 TRINITY_DN11679_c0_g4_i2:290-835(+)